MATPFQFDGERVLRGIEGYLCVSPLICTYPFICSWQNHRVECAPCYVPMHSKQNQFHYKSFSVERCAVGSGWVSRGVRERVCRWWDKCLLSSSSLLSSSNDHHSHLWGFKTIPVKRRAQKTLSSPESDWVRISMFTANTHLYKYVM